MKLIGVSTICIALVFLSFFHLSLSDDNSNADKNLTLTGLNEREEIRCNSTTTTSLEESKEKCKKASGELDSKNYTSCCFVKASYNVEASDTSSSSSSTRLLTENTKTDYGCVRLFKGSVYIQKEKEKEKYKDYDKVEIKCFSSSTILKQGLIIGIALMLLI